MDTLERAMRILLEARLRTGVRVLGQTFCSSTSGCSLTQWLIGKNLAVREER